MSFLLSIFKPTFTSAMRWAASLVISYVIMWCPGVVQNGLRIYSAMQAELPADASPLAQKVYGQLGSAEGWKLTDQSGNTILRRGNTRVQIGENCVRILAGDSEFDAFSARERSAIAIRAGQVRDKIREMRRDALTRELFRDEGAVVKK